MVGVKVGRALGFTEVQVLNSDGDTVATGKHTKAFPAASM